VIATHNSLVGRKDSLLGSDIRLLPSSVDEDAAIRSAVRIVALMVESAKETSKEKKHKRTIADIAVESVFEVQSAPRRKSS